MTLTDEQKLGMTETIARAMGKIPKRGDRSIFWWHYPKDRPQDDLRDRIYFKPFDDWNDAMRAREALLPLADFSVKYDHFHTDPPWVLVTITVDIHPDLGPDPVFEGRGANELEAFASAVNEIAKAKLEEE